MPFPGGRTELNNGTLTIKNLILADSGLYDCIATNAMGTKKTRINVVVQRKPGKLRDILKVVFQRGFNTAVIFFLMLRRSLNSSAETAKNVVLHFLSTRIFRKRFLNNNKQVSAIKNFKRGVCCRAISLGVIIKA